MQKRNISKLINWILFVLFLSFAWLQFNDPDAAVWVSIYAAIALLFGFSNVKSIPKKWIVISLICLAVFAIYHLPHFLEWLKSPNKSELFGEMVYQKPDIEGSREFMGLLIAIVALLYLLKQQEK